MNEQRSETVPKKTKEKGLAEELSPINPLDGVDVDAMSFDVGKYLEAAKDFDMSEQEKGELLAILWDIMRRFVELGWGLDSVSILEGEMALKPSKNADFEVEYKDNQ